MNTREIQNIFVGDTQGSKLYLGDELVWPVEPHVYITALTLNVATAITDSGVATVSYSPANAETNIVYSSSDNTVAVIDGQGNITVLDDGQVTICASDTYTNISDCKVVTVTKTGPDTGITPSTSITLNVDSAITDYGVATVTVGPSDADVDLVFSSSDNSIATVDQNGNITVLDDGQVTICVTDRNSGLRDCETVTVTKSVSPIPPGPGVPEDGWVIRVYLDVTSTTTPTKVSGQNTQNHFVKAILDNDYDILPDLVWRNGTGRERGYYYTFGRTGLRYIDFYYKQNLSPYVNDGFNAVDSLLYAIVNNQVPRIEDVFESNYNLTYVKIGNNVQEIGLTCFYNSDAITSITIPNSVTTIGRNAFADCSNLQNITIGSGLTQILEGGFRDCTSIEEITLPDAINIIDDGVFSGCTSLENIVLGSSLTFLGDSSFENCTSLNSITFAASTAPTLDGDRVFYGVSPTGTYYYPSGSDYARIANALPQGWVGVSV